MKRRGYDAGGERFSLVTAKLNEYKSYTMEALLASVPAKEPREYLYDLVPEYPNRPGKGFRPSLCIATCRAFGGHASQVRRCAVALELLHNAFLVHDDVEDESLQRRGLPTLSAEYGVGIAVNVGDAMQVLSLRPLMHNVSVLGPALSWRIFSEFEHLVRQSVEGQAMEIGWVHDNLNDLDDGDYLRMTLKKTCWYTCIHPCRIGALVATAGAINPDRFNRFGYYLGAAFQIQDDLLNLIGERAKYGKEIGGDIWEGKRTLVLIHLLNRCAPDERRWLRRFLAAPRASRSARDVRRVYRLIGRYRCIDYARSCSRQLAGAALREFIVAYGDRPETEDRQFLQDLVLYMIERDL